MKLLVFEWGAYTQHDINDFFTRNHIAFKSISYQFRDKNSDTFFEERFPLYLKEAHYDAVFSVNYFPLVAKACYHHNIKYLSWCYDNPLNVVNIEATLGLSTNYVFLFDRIQAKTYRDKGFDNIYHLPLGINSHRLSNIIITPNDEKIYSSDISFVGKLYPSTISELLAPLGQSDKNFINDIMDQQLKIYGSYIIDDLLTEDLITRINLQYNSLMKENNFTLTKEELSYSMATYVARTERLLLLALLANHHEVCLYSRENLDFLSKVHYKGSAAYLTDMPKVFQCSKINLNITLKILQTGIPLRVLDILGSAGLLLTNFQEEILEHFVNERDLMVYESIEDALAKSTFLLKHDDIRLLIAYNGYCKVNELFSYEKLFNKLFETSKISM